jgi:L-ascorbate metabolism protein UlaG (beta-lactamase superfamily)
MRSRVGYRYTNLDADHRPHGPREVWRWGVWDRLTGRRKIEPPGPGAPRVEPRLERVRQSGGGPRLTWIGHASFLGTLGGASFLIDPVFSERIARMIPRHVPPGLGPDELPPLQALLVTHNHYDHLDAASVLALSRAIAVCVPTGLGRWFRRRGFRDVRELGWWEQTRTDSLRVTLVPANHWSRRFIGDTNATLWGGFVVDSPAGAVYHAGDTSWFDGFDEIGRRFPGLLAAMLPIGSYSPPWFMEHHHLNPEQAGRAFERIGARNLVAMHWGTFKLTDEPLREPAERMRAWWQSRGLDGERRLHVPAVGETVELGRDGEKP